MIGWVVLSRERAGSSAISLVVVVERRFAETEEIALELAKPKLEKKPVFKTATVRVMERAAETKRNLSEALHRLGFLAQNLDAVYNSIARLIDDNTHRSQ